MSVYPCFSLRDVHVGDTVTVTGFVTKDPALRCRLLHMGLTPGISVTVVKKAPLGDPLQLSLRGYMLVLRRSDAALIRVSRQPAVKKNLKAKTR